MLLNKIRNILLPKQFLFRLTFINILVITSFIGLSSWAIYNTACILADGFVTMSNQKQAQFEATLLQYLWIFSISTTIIGSMTQFYLTRKMIRPLRDLIQSTKEMKRGNYPHAIRVKPDGEVGELIRHFNDLVYQLKNNEQQRQKLVTDLSHEIRTPLSNLNGYLRALRNGVIKADNTLYQSLYEESNRLIQLVDQMEQLKEWEHVSTQIISEKYPVDIKKLVEQSVDMFRWVLKQSNIHINLEIQYCILTLNKGEISKVISNLMDNAIRYYEGKGPITLKGENLTDGYKLSIAGPGEAIPEVDKERIFERFYRVDHSRSRKSGGSGLGLAISKEIIEHHCGNIGVHSKGNVNTFWFQLPRK